MSRRGGALRLMMVAKKWEKLIMGKTATVVKTSWHLIYPGGVKKRSIGRRNYAQFVLRLREDLDLILSGYSVRAETHTFEVPACKHCKARPVVWDGDYGQYCDHPLCIKGRTIAHEGLSKESSDTIREFFDR